MSGELPDVPLTDANLDAWYEQVGPEQEQNQYRISHTSLERIQADLAAMTQRAELLKVERDAAIMQAVRAEGLLREVVANAGAAGCIVPFALQDRIRAVLAAAGERGE